MDLTANEIYIMKKKLGPISVVLYCCSVPCVASFHPRGAGGQSWLPAARGLRQKNPQRNNGHAPLLISDDAIIIIEQYEE